MNEYAVRTAPTEVRIERLLPGPIERVWAHLVESEKRATWLAAGAIELHQGGCVAHVFRNSALTTNDDPAPAKYAREAHEHHMSGQVLACEPPHLLAYTWGDGDEASAVRFELQPRGDEVLLVVTHSLLHTRYAMLSVAGGWHVHLDILRARLTDSTPPKFWQSHTRLEAEYAERFSS